MRIRVEAAFDNLTESGPTLGRPLVDRMHGSRLHNLKELRPASVGRTEVRILFVGDPERDAQERTAVSDGWPQRSPTRSRSTQAGDAERGRAAGPAQTCASGRGVRSGPSVIRVPGRADRP
ncbi:type II toxin-antitoxin system RelE/ParE family toxin [Streptomyces bluensis]|uniref:type II toxin-antitoxin system RelE/ParE family toxin n=1 Tax=Streptomyces bluensis TaxID=33897 RepID=UPI003329EA70